MELYRLQTRRWSSLPNLNIARQSASSCCHGGYIYTFGGRTTGNDVTNSIERLSISHLQASFKGPLSGSAWELIEPPESQLQKRADAVMVSCNETEIMILGGVNLRHHKLCDVTILSTANEFPNGTF